MQGPPRRASVVSVRNEAIALGEASASRLLALVESPRFVIASAGHCDDNDVYLRRAASW